MITNKFRVKIIKMLFILYFNMNKQTKLTQIYTNLINDICAINDKTIDFELVYKQLISDICAINQSKEINNLSNKPKSNKPKTNKPKTKSKSDQSKSKTNQSNIIHINKTIKLNLDIELDLNLCLNINAKPNVV
jgi:hypothetical protein